MGDSEAYIRYVILRNPYQARQDRDTRDGIVKALQEELAGLKRLPKEQHTKAVSSLVALAARRTWCKHALATLTRAP